MPYIFNTEETIFIGADHAGLSYKKRITHYLQEKKIRVEDCGTFTEESCDYPDFAFAVADKIEILSGKGFGILICGSGNGVAMVANKLGHIRAAICWNEDITLLARKHNNANIICLPSRFLNISVCIDYMNIFFSTAFEGGRHQRRVDKMIRKD